jgi:hypothetical protein
MNYTPAVIRQRFEQLVASRQVVQAKWDDCERYIAPFRGGRFFNEQKGESQKDYGSITDVWDSTAIMGAQRLAASIHTAITSPAIRWFRLAFRDAAIQKDKAAKSWLDDCSDKMFDEIQASDFNTEISCAYQDMVVFGPSAMIAEAQAQKFQGLWNGLDYTCVPIREIYFEEDEKSRAKVFYRRLQWTPVQILSKFAEKTPEWIRLKAENSTGVEDRIDLIFCIFKRDNIQPLRLGEVRAPTLRPYGYKYVLRNTGDEIGEEGGYYDMPAYIARWEKTSGSIWGHGPGMIALPTVKYLNAWMEAQKNSAEKQVDPSMLVTERGLISDPDLTPGGITVVRSLEDIKMFESGARQDVAVQVLMDLREMVRKFFREDDLQLKQSPQMTATEAQIRYELMNRILGSTMARIQNDLLDPLLQTTFNIMYREQQFAQPPQSILNTRAEMQIEYLGPLMRSQRTDEVGAIERLIQSIGTAAQFFPEVTDVLDPIQAVREIAERLSTPANILNDPNQIAIKQAQRQKMQQAMQAEQEGKAKNQHAQAAAAMAQASQQGGQPANA